LSPNSNVGHYRDSAVHRELDVHYRTPIYT
jgi:hypothetical protein